MLELSILKKVQIVLLILIVLAGATFTKMFFEHKQLENFVAEQTLVSLNEQKEKEEKTKKEEDYSWDEEIVEDTEVDMTDEENAEEKNEKKYYIKINYTANCITVYTKDSEGKYTVPYKAIICSTGKATPTSGVYKLGEKYRWHQLNGGVYGQYCSRITGHILFHSVPYATNSPDSLKYVAYDKLGTKASAGCIRLTVEDAIWIYNNCDSGTYVEFYSSSNPGPLGKPSAKKIADNETCRNWDPTDPDKKNPWRTYKEPVKVEEQTVKENETSKQENIWNTPQEQNNSTSNQESEDRQLEVNQEKESEKEPEKIPEKEPEKENTNVTNNTVNTNTSNNSVSNNTTKNNNTVNETANTSTENTTE